MDTIGSDIIIDICDYLQYVDIVSLSRLNRQFNQNLHKIVYNLRIAKKYAKVWQSRTFAAKRYTDLFGMSPSDAELENGRVMIAAGRPDLCCERTKRIFVPKFTDIQCDFVYVKTFEIPAEDKLKRYNYSNYMDSDSDDSYGDDYSDGSGIDNSDSGNDSNSGNDNSDNDNSDNTTPYTSFNLTCKEPKDLVDIGIPGLNPDTVLEFSLSDTPIRRKRVSECVQHNNKTWLFDKYFQLPLYLINGGITVTIIGQTMSETIYCELKYRLSDKRYDDIVWIPCFTNKNTNAVKNILIIVNGYCGRRSLNYLR